MAQIVDHLTAAGIGFIIAVSAGSVEGLRGAKCKNLVFGVAQSWVVTRPP